MLSLVNRFWKHERGATATEYAMLVVFIALAIAVGAQALGSGLGNTLTNIGNMISHHVRGRQALHEVQLVLKITAKALCPSPLGVG